MQLLHDFLLVKEVVETGTLEGTSLTLKYDDTQRFMVVEIISISPMLLTCYKKEYQNISESDMEMLKNVYKVGNKLVVSRVAKTPYKDGLLFISYKDVIAYLND